jgi:hypothetical protein
MKEKSSIYVICAESNYEEEESIVSHYSKLEIPTLRGSLGQVADEAIAGVVIDDLDISPTQRFTYDFYKEIGKPTLLFTTRGAIGPAIRDGSEWVMWRNAVEISRKAMLGMFAETLCGLKPNYSHPEDID